MALRWTRFALPFAAALTTTLALATPALAEGEDCVRDTDCNGSELCLGGLCAVAESPPPTCDAGCEFDETCDDGFCKVEGVACDNPAGRCWVEQDHGLCECIAGEGAGWSDGFNPDDPPQTKTDDEMFAQCGDTLVKVCGTQAPSLPDSCVAEVLTDCEALLEHENTAAQDCGEDSAEVTISRLGECCDRFEEPDYADYRACLTASDAPTCEQHDQCVNEVDSGGGENDGDTDGTTDPTEGGTGVIGGDTDTSAGVADEDPSGCSTGQGGQGWGLLALFTLLPLVRRRR